MRYFSMFSGIGGFERGIQQAYNYYHEGEGRDSISTPSNMRDYNGDQYEQKRSRPTCIGYSEIDKYASAIYRYHYPKHKNYGDATAITVSELPYFDLLVGGFPCQAFSIAGKRQGFKDTRGTLFFDVARVLESKRPEWVVLENVKGLLNHDSGETVATIYEVLTELGYTVGWEVVNSCHFGVPQNRERIFIVGHLTATGGRTGEVLPFGEGESEDYAKNLQQSNGSIAGTLNTKNNSGQLSVDKGTVLVKSGAWRTHKDGRGFRELDNPDISPCIPARAREDGSGQPVVAIKGKGFEDTKISNAIDANYYKGMDNHGQRTGIKIDSHIRRLTPIECERLQGFPDNWTQYGIMGGKKVEISDTQRYKALGNAVTVNVIEAIMYKILSIV